MSQTQNAKAPRVRQRNRRTAMHPEALAGERHCHETRRRRHAAECSEALLEIRRALRTF